MVPGKEAIHVELLHELQLQALSFQRTEMGPYITATNVRTQEVSAIHTLESCKSIANVKQVHAFQIKTRLLQDARLLCYKILSLADLSRDEDRSYAHSVIKHSENADVYLYNAIIRSLSISGCKSSCSSKAMALHGEMLTKDLIPDTSTVPKVLKACAQSQALREGQQIHAHSIKTGLLLDVYVINNLMRLYAVCGLIHAVRYLFDRAPQRDLVSWTTLIQAFAKMGHTREAILAFFDMCRADLRADGMTLAIVLSACSRLGDLSLGKKIHGYICRNNVNSDVFVGNALVDMYSKCYDTDHARKVFDAMPVKNAVSWNSMMSGLAQHGKYRQALDMFGVMQSRGFKPDNVTLVCVLNCCANLGLLDLGKWVHAYIDKNNFGADGFIGNALIDMYAKCGSIEGALSVFQAMTVRDVYSYTAVIRGLAMHGEAERALQIFSEMPRLGMQPDEVTFVGVLSACSHAGLVEEGQKHFDDMTRVYKLKPQTEHYGCMVDLLGRAGLITEAEYFIKNMPILPDAFVWSALLAACKIHSKVELAENVMEKLVEIEPGKDGAYILMSNIYSSANRFKDAVNLRKSMKEKNIKKTPGCSSIQVDGMVYEFRKGDKTHPKHKEIYKLLEDMASHLKSYGHLNSCSHSC